MGSRTTRSEQHLELFFNGFHVKSWIVAFTLCPDFERVQPA